MDGNIARWLYYGFYLLYMFLIMYLSMNLFINKVRFQKRFFYIIPTIIILTILDHYIMSFSAKQSFLFFVFYAFWTYFNFFVLVYILNGKKNLYINYVKLIFIHSLISLGEGVVVENFLPKLGVYHFLMNGILMVVTSTFLFLLKKLGLKKVIDNVFNSKIAIVLMLPLLLLITILGLTGMMGEENSIAIKLNLGLFTLVVIFYFAGAFIEYNRKNKELNETIILQQETYIKSLESMQEDIRKYNHDYKNLLTGALLQAEEGDYDGVRLYLKDVFDEFEEKLGKQISKNTQLKKIKSNEVKGLLLSKMSKMEEIKIEFHLEVLNEVDRINMKTTDLVRCLGILLDNAIEEVEKLEEKVIKLVILQEEKVTTIMVKNPVTEKVNIQNIYEEGFSTKGEKRGLGLSNYKEIVENYENIVRETISTEREFNQILKIA